MKELVSICVPTYEMKGEGKEYLEILFQSIHSQTYKNVEVIISDHSISDDIEKLCFEWESLLNIKYYKNEYKRGSSSANVNNAIKKASGDFIKILFQDDFFYNEESLFNQIDCIVKSKGHWLVTACCHFNGIDIYNPFYPKYHDSIQYGVNTISSPSVLLMKNQDIIEFDENLIWLMDVDYYKRLYNKFGLPTICDHITIVNREHKNQISNTLATEEVRNEELKYVIKKYETINNIS